MRIHWCISFFFYYTILVHFFFLNTCTRTVLRHDQRNRGKNSSVKSRGWINEYPHANNTTRSSASIDLYYFHEHPRHDPFRRLFCHYRGRIFIQGGVLPVSHQEGTILPLNSSGETIIRFLLDNSLVGPIRFGNPLPTVLPICPDLQN